MKKYFVISDVHSFYHEMMKALDNAGFDVSNNEHILISLGDLLDRGEYPLECLNFVNSIPDERKFLVRGNHETLFDEMIDRGSYDIIDLSNKTLHTALYLSGNDKILLGEGDEAREAFHKIKVSKEVSKYESSLVNYCEIGDRIFVHGWLPSEQHLIKGKSKYTLIDDDIKSFSDDDWKEAAWINGMKAANDHAIIKGKTVYCGHWHTSWGHSHIERKSKEFGPDADYTPFISDGIVAIDSCVAVSGFLNCVTFEE